MGTSVCGPSQAVVKPRPPTAITGPCAGLQASAVALLRTVDGVITRQAAQERLNGQTHLYSHCRCHGTRRIHKRVYSQFNHSRGFSKRSKAECRARASQTVRLSLQTVQRVCILLVVKDLTPERFDASESLGQGTAVIRTLLFHKDQESGIGLSHSGRTVVGDLARKRPLSCKVRGRDKCLQRQRREQRGYAPGFIVSKRFTASFIHPPGAPESQMRAAFYLPEFPGKHRRRWRYSPPPFRCHIWRWLRAYPPRRQSKMRCFRQ